MGVVYDQRDTVWSPPNKAVDANGATYGTIQEAVDAATGLVLIGPGTFTENVLVPNNADQAGVTIRGIGRSTVIDGGTSGHALDVRADDPSISFLTAKTTGGAGNTNDAIAIGEGNPNLPVPSVENVTVTESDRNGIRFIDCDSGWIDGCDVRESDHRAIVETGTDNRIMNNHIGRSGGGTITTGVRSVGNNSRVLSNRIEDATTGISLEATDQIAKHNRLSGTTTNIDTSSATTPIVLENHPLSSNLPNAAELVDSPNGHIENVVLDDTESAEISVPVPDGETLEVFRWGAYQISDGSTPANLDVELLDGADTAQATANTGNNESTDATSPVASHTNSSGSISIFKLRVKNSTGATIADPGVGAIFAYAVG